MQPETALRVHSLKYLVSFLLLPFFAVAQDATLQGNNTLDQLTEVQQKNKMAQGTYTIAAVKLAQEGAYKFAHGGECQLSCPFGCCDSSDGLVLEGGLFMVLNNQATMQARTHQLVATEACNTFNKISAAAKNCAAEIKPFAFTKPEPNWLDDKGKCKSGAPSECQLIAMMPGSAVFRNKQVNCKKNKAAPCAQDFYSTYTTNGDGSVSIKTSKRTVKLDADSLKDAKSLVAAGVPSDMAEALLAQFGLMQKKLGNAKADLLALNQSTQKLAEPVKNLETAEVLAAVGKVAAMPGEQKEKPGRESLQKSYRGEFIHVSTSNIFEVMTLRYKKTLDTLLP